MRINKLCIFILCVSISACKEDVKETNTSTKLSDSTQTEKVDFDKIGEHDTLIELIKKITPSTFADCRIEIKTKTKINERTSYILYELSDGVSLTDYLMTFTDNKHVDHEAIEETHDQDFSITHYEFRTLKNSKKNYFLIANYYQIPADKKVLAQDNSYFKEGFNFENVKIKTDSIIIALTVESNGIIRRDTIN